MLVCGSSPRFMIDGKLLQRLRHAQAVSVSISAVMRAGRYAA